MKYKYSIQIGRRNVWQLFIMYLCVLLYLVFLTPNRYEGVKNAPILLPLVHTAERFHKPPQEHFWPYYIEYWINIIGNILLFMPFGFLMAYLCLNIKPNRIILYGMAFSCGIEGIQYFLSIGVCDIDDVILNTCGTIAGIAFYKRQTFLQS